ncbi:hypothetical protein TNCT_658261 [Trichonephila clavata]|uniref:Uncharacterized protein n=1 Tax=Trichonephila clavata TaxID=2740835 RepID=A0A8X6HWG1_TRICU|nr:hypothetical protein TNCT_658261 [Trichonephila clavata]
MKWKIDEFPLHIKEPEREKYFPRKTAAKSSPRGLGERFHKNNVHRFTIAVMPSEHDSQDKILYGVELSCLCTRTAALSAASKGLENDQSSRSGGGGEWLTYNFIYFEEVVLTGLLLME